MPYDSDAEQATIGAVLLDAGQADTLMEILPTAEAFYLERHAVIWRAIQHCVAQRRPPDLISVSARLRQMAGDRTPVGIDELDACMAHAADPGRAPYYATIVAEAYERRSLIAAGGRVSLLGYDARMSVAEAQDAAAQEVLSLGASNLGGGFVGIGAAARQRAAEYAIGEDATGKSLAGISTPWPDMNRIIGGLKPGKLIIIGGRPSMGKSALVGDIAEHVAARLGLHVGMFSMEMDTAEWTDRFVSKITGIPLDAITNDQVQTRDKPRLLDAITALDSWHLSIDDRAGHTITSLRSRARRIHAQNPLALLIVDYVQLTDYGDQEENKALTRISQGLKNLARELHIPVLALSQLGRELEKRPNKRPMMSDLRGSGSLEQDADVIAFIYRDEKYYPDTKDKGIAEIAIAKQRNGPTGLVRLAFTDQSASFRSLDTYRAPDGY